MTSDGIAGKWLHWIGLFALILSLAAFSLYILGILPPGLDPASSAGAWSEPVGDYLAETGTAAGALWMFRSADGYSMSVAALAILASTALPVLLVLAIRWLRRKDWIYGIMALAVFGVLVTAAVS